MFLPPCAGQEEQIGKPAGRAPRVLTDKQIVHHGGMLKKLDVLERAGNAQRGNLVRSQAGDVLPVKADNAAGRIVNPADYIEDRRLARPVWPNDCKDFSGLDLETHAVHRLHTAERNRKVFN